MPRFARYIGKGEEHEDSNRFCGVLRHFGRCERKGGHSSGGSPSVSGHVRRNGTYVPPSHAANPNATKTDNWSTKGNVNPYTGKAGTK